jgi:hypothetical protein
MIPSCRCRVIREKKRREVIALRTISFTTHSTEVNEVEKKES